MWNSHVERHWPVQRIQQIVKHNKSQLSRKWLNVGTECQVRQLENYNYRVNKLTLSAYKYSKSHYLDANDGLIDQWSQQTNI